MDGLPVKSCLVLACAAEGKQILTVEGIGQSPLAKAFSEARAFQCGYCTPGFLMASYALLQNEPQADEGTMEEWLQANICRCTSYAEIRAALRAVLPSTARP
jgi:carbon-monoxide dehydrogenase small subunit